MLQIQGFLHSFGSCLYQVHAISHADLLHVKYVYGKKCVFYLAMLYLRHHQTGKIRTYRTCKRYKVWLKVTLYDA